MTMWTCSRCQSEVEDSFEVCWSCGTSIDGVEDPDFVNADEYAPIPDEPVDVEALADDPLADFAGMPFPELAECYMAENVVEAKFVADRLMENGIPAVAGDVDMNMMLGGFQPRQWGYGPRVRVRRDDLPKALAWIDDYRRLRKERSEEQG